MQLVVDDANTDAKKKRGGHQFVGIRGLESDPMRVYIYICECVCTCVCFDSDRYHR